MCWEPNYFQKQNGTERNETVSIVVVLPQHIIIINIQFKKYMYPSKYLYFSMKNTILKRL